MTGKPVKLSQRKQSRYAVEKRLEAEDALRGFTQQQIADAKARLDVRNQEEPALPLHIKLLRKHGIRWDLPADSDVERLMEAESLLEREKEHPGDFASAPVSTAIKSDTSSHQPKRRKGSTFKELDEIVGAVLKKPKYSRKWDGWITAAVSDVYGEYAERFPFDKHPTVRRPSSDTTVRNAIERIQAKKSSS